MYIFISITLASLGLYFLANGDSQLASIGMTGAGVFAALLAIKVNSLQEQLTWEKELKKKLSKAPSKKSAKPKKVNTSPLKPQDADKSELPTTPNEPIAGPAKKEIASPRPRALQPPTPVSKAPEPPSYLEPDPPEFLDPEAPDDSDYGPEEPANIEPDPESSIRAPRIRHAYHPPAVITRTSKGAGGYTQETWKGERTWLPLEIDELIELYSEGDSLESIAIKLQIDVKDVVYKLTRLNFNESGDLEDLSEAPNDGKKWSEEHSKKLLEMAVAGITLSGTARILGRTKLAIGWRLAENRKLLDIYKRGK